MNSRIPSKPCQTLLAQHVPSVTGVENLHRGGENFAPKEREIKEGENRRVAVDRLGRNSVGERLSAVMEMSRTRRAGFAAKREAKRAGAKAPSISNLWINAHKETFPDRPVSPLLIKELHVLSRLEKSFVSRGRKDFREFLDWSLRYWPLLIETRFNFIKGGRPRFPNVAFYAKCTRIFEEAFSNRVHFERLAKKTERERIVDHLMETKGMAREAAERLADQRLGLQKLRDDAAAAVEKLKRFHFLEKLRADEAMLKTMAMNACQHFESGEGNA